MEGWKVRYPVGISGRQHKQQTANSAKALARFLAGNIVCVHGLMVLWQRSGSFVEQIGAVMLGY